MLFFFFQAEDGIRDYKVTGVQTCALPISWSWSTSTDRPWPSVWRRARWRSKSSWLTEWTWPTRSRRPTSTESFTAIRSEERRVGKEGRARWARKPWRRKEGGDKEGRQERE